MILAANARDADGRQLHRSARAVVSVVESNEVVGEQAGRVACHDPLSDAASCSKNRASDAPLHRDVSLKLRVRVRWAWQAKGLSGARFGHR